MVLKLLQMFVLLRELLLQLQKLLFFSHTDGIILIGLLSLCECIAVQSKLLAYVFVICQLSGMHGNVPACDASGPWSSSITSGHGTSCG
jgi:hypothetical protein